MSLATACAIGLYFAGVVAVLAGLRHLTTPKPEVIHPPSDLKRPARLERIEEARRRGLHVVNKPKDAA